MDFFTSNVKTSTSGHESDPICLAAGHTADEAMLFSFREDAAFWAAFNRRSTEDVDREYPGYREALKQFGRDHSL